MKKKTRVKKNNRKRILQIIINIFLIFIVILLFLILMIHFAEKQLDDVSTGIPCEEKLLKESDILFVIPKFNNISIAENKTWCNYILSLNKKLAMHGIYHTYQEFNTDRNDAYLDEGVKIFEQCFGKRPEKFKPPQLAISKNNKKLIKAKMKLYLTLTPLFHKGYHCNDSGNIKNKFWDMI